MLPWDNSVTKTVWIVAYRCSLEANCVALVTTNNNTILSFTNSLKSYEVSVCYVLNDALGLEAKIT